MSEQVPLSDEAIAQQPEMDAARGDHTAEVAHDVAYRRLALVNVAFVGAPGAGDRGWVLIDAGLRGTAGFIRAAAEARFGEDARPSAIILTHGHFDHVGALGKLSEDWDTPIYAHPLEHPYLTGHASYPPGDPTVGGGAMSLIARFYPRGPIDVASRLAALPADGNVPGMAGWRWIHTPGHSVGHVALWREADRLLLPGDAVISTRQESAYAVATQEAEMHGPPSYYTIDWDAAEASVRTLAALQPETLLPMHGRPLHGPEMRTALDRLAAEFRDVAVPKQGRYVAQPRHAEDGSAYET